MNEKQQWQNEGEYQSPALTVVRYAEDVITTSGGDGTFTGTGSYNMQWWQEN